MIPDPSLAAEEYCYLTTTGRVSGEPRTIEIWFALQDGRLYMLAGGRERAQWVRNLLQTPAVSLRIVETTYAGTARVIESEDESALARRLLFEKYSPGYSGSLESWRDTALPVAVDFQVAS